MFSVHTTPEKFKNAARITGRFGFVFEVNSGRKITWLSSRDHFQKALFSKCFSSTRKRKAGVYKFLRFEECFRKAPFSERISVDGTPNRRNKAAFSNFSCIAWTRPIVKRHRMIANKTKRTWEHCWCARPFPEQPQRFRAKRYVITSFVK